MSDDATEEPKKSDEELAAEWAAAMEDSGDTPDGDIADILADAEAQLQGNSGGGDAAPLPDLAAGGAPAPAPVVDHSANQNLDVILDIPVRLSMEVGNTEVSIGELLKLNRGSVVELDRLAGEPLDVLVNGTLVAHGEVVVINDKFGVRLIDVLSPQDRIRTLT